jgi:hypothetical protein
VVDIPRCCGNRHCPNCQHGKALQWMQTQLEKGLPGHHFMITFTVPEQIRRFMRSHQRDAYGALFKASSGAMKKLALDEKHLGGDVPGFFGVLHTWGRQMHYHPHVHYVAPGGAFCKKDGQWHPSRLDFYLPVKALSAIYRAKFRDLMKNKGLFHLIPENVWRIDWNVNIQAVGNADQTIRYMSFYVFKVAISDSRIVKVENDQVTFRYKMTKSNRYRTLTLDVFEFMRRFLQHVLPPGFMKVRYYGFMSHSSSVKLPRIRALIELSLGFEVRTAEVNVKPPAPMLCPACGGELKYWYTILAYQMHAYVFDTG